jgi:hypothetical protein
LSRVYIVRVVCCAATLLLSVTGCGSHNSGRGDGPQLVTPGAPNTVTVGLGHVQPDDVQSFGSMILCLDRKGSVTLTGVQPVQPHGGVQIKEWGVRPSPWWKHDHGTGIGALHGDLAHNHFAIGRKVSVTCDPATGRGYELAVSVSMPDRTPASMRGLHVEYDSNGQQRSLDYPITILLCPRGEVGDTCVAD